MKERNGVELRDIATGKIGIPLTMADFTGIIDLTDIDEAALGATGGPRGKHPRAFVVPDGAPVTYVGLDMVTRETPDVGGPWQWDWQIQGIDSDAVGAAPVVVVIY